MFYLLIYYIFQDINYFNVSVGAKPSFANYYVEN